jgi:hypothetical protein
MAGHMARILKLAPKMPDYPFGYSVNARPVSSGKELDRVVNDAIDSADLLIIGENVATLSERDGYNALVRHGFGSGSAPPAVLLTNFHTCYKQVGVSCYSQPGMMVRSFNGLRSIVRCNVGIEHELPVSRQGFIFEEVAPMLKHADAVLFQGRNTHGDHLEVFRRVIAGEYLGSGIFFVNGKQHFSPNTMHLSPYWAKISDEAKQLKKAPLPRSERYSAELQAYLA